MYRAVFKPVTRKNLQKSAKKMVNKEYYFVPVTQVKGGEYEGQWVFRCKDSEFLFLERDLVIKEEICEPIEEAAPDKGQE
jgi:hypothetical protein